MVLGLVLLPVLWLLVLGCWVLMFYRVVIRGPYSRTLRLTRAVFLVFATGISVWYVRVLPRGVVLHAYGFRLLVERHFDFPKARQTMRQIQFAGDHDEWVTEVISDGDQLRLVHGIPVLQGPDGSGPQGVLQFLPNVAGSRIAKPGDTFSLWVGEEGMRFTFGGGFGHWGLVVFLENGTIPSSDEHEFVLPVRNDSKSYVWEQLWQ